jgi:hypothetical protein
MPMVMVVTLHLLIKKKIFLHEAEYIIKAFVNNSLVPTVADGP